MIDWFNNLHISDRAFIIYCIIWIIIIYFRDWLTCEINYIRELRRRKYDIEEDYNIYERDELEYLPLYDNWEDYI